MNITEATLRQAASYVTMVDADAEVHTVKLTTNGATGRVDLIIEGAARKELPDYDEGDQYIRRYEVYS